MRAATVAVQAIGAGSCRCRLSPERHIGLCTEKPRYVKTKTTVDDAWMDSELARLEIEHHKRIHSKANQRTDDITG
jgi:hypothetical protein